MSRYVVSDNPEIVVGWDPPLGHFFAHKYDQYGDLAEERESPDLYNIWLWVTKVLGANMDHVLEDVLADSKSSWTPGTLQRAFGFTGRSA